MIEITMHKITPKHLPEQKYDITDRVYKESLHSINQKLEIGRFAFFMDELSLRVNNFDGFFDFLSVEAEAVGACIIVRFNRTEIFRGDSYRYEPTFHDSKPRYAVIVFRNCLSRTAKATIDTETTIRGGIPAIAEKMQELLASLNDRMSPPLRGIEIDTNIQPSSFELDMPIDHESEDVIFDNHTGAYYGLIYHYDAGFADLGRIQYSIFEIESKTNVRYLRTVYHFMTSRGERTPSWSDAPPRFIRANMMAGHIGIIHLGRVIIIDLDSTARSVVEGGLLDEMHDRILIRTDGSISTFDDPVHADDRFYYLEKIRPGGAKSLEKYNPATDSLIATIDLPISRRDDLFVIDTETIAYFSGGIMTVRHFDDTAPIQTITDLPETDGIIYPVRNGSCYYFSHNDKKWRTTDSRHFTVNIMTYPSGASLFDMLCDLAQLVDGCIFMREGRIYLKARNSFIQEHNIPSDYLAHKPLMRSFVNISCDMPKISFTAINFGDDYENPFGNHTIMGSIRSYYRAKYGTPRRRRSFMVPANIAIGINPGDKITLSVERHSEEGIVIEREMVITKSGELSKIVIEGDVK